MCVRMLAIYGLPMGLMVSGFLIDWFGYLATASGYCIFGLAATAYRGASLTLETGTDFVMAAAYTLVWSQFTQSLQLGGWLLWRNPQALVVVMREWRRSLLAGFMGAAASGGWFTAMAIEPVAHVRTLGLVELLFSMALSRRMFRERLSPLELTGIAVLTLGLVAITQGK